MARSDIEWLGREGTSPESWRRVPEYSDYLVSDMGKIRSLKNNGTDFLSPMKSRSGHLYVFLYDGHGNSNKVWVHRAVLTAFVGPPALGQETRHLDGNPENNYLDNLRWGTRYENANDRRLHGRMPIPHESGSTKLSSEDIPVIRGLQGIKSSRYIGAMFGTSHTTILKIWRGRRWKGY